MEKKLIFTIKVKTYNSEMVCSQKARVVMIPFEAEAVGEYFNGKTIGQCVDTQVTEGTAFSLSARYMLEGNDNNGQKCRLFIENNGTSLENCIPTIYTDSDALAFLENAELTASAECIDGGVIVRIYAMV